MFEIIRKRQKNIILGCIYRHPSNDRTQFHERLEATLTELNGKGYELFLLGDMNINFLKYNVDASTSEYLDMLFGKGFICQ
jgi:hypothetical protein